MEVPNGWLQVLRGPRPPVARRLLSEKKVAKDPSSVQQRERQPGQLGGRPVQAQNSSGGRNCTPVGHDDYVRRLLEKVQAKQQVLLDVIPKVPDVQSAWLLLLRCASARANYQLRVIIRPGLVESFAESHDQGLWRCLCAILEVPVDTCDGDQSYGHIASVIGWPWFKERRAYEGGHLLGQLGRCSAMIQARHPAVAALMVQHLEGE